MGHGENPLELFGIIITMTLSKLNPIESEREKSSSQIDRKSIIVNKNVQS